MPPRQKTTELLRWIEESGVLRGTVDTGEAAGVLTALADTGDVRGIPYIAPFALSEDLVLARAGAGALEQLFVRAHVKDFIWLERNVRVSLSYRYGREPWREVRPSEVQRLALRSDHPTAVYGLLSLHWNGYVREEALRRLATADPRAAAPFVLLRLNDWVEEVREAARELVRTWLERSELLPLALNLPLVVRLRTPVRARQEDLAEEIAQRLLAEEPPAALRRACRSPDRTVRREAFALALCPGGSLAGWVVDQGLACTDAVVRLRTLRRLVASRAPAADVARLRPLLEDPFMPARREALQALAGVPEHGLEALRDAVLDPHPAIRYTARWHLSRAGKEDFAPRYRAVLQAPPSKRRLLAALAGLGEVGTPEDLDAIRHLFEHPAAKVRAAAVRSAAKLSPCSEVDLLLERLDDESPKVSREALQGLRDRVHLVGGPRLWALFGAARTPHGRRHLLRFLGRLPVGERLVYLLRVAATPEEPLADEALGIVTATLHRPNLGYTQLSPSEVETIRQELDAVGSRLSQAARQYLELLLSSCSG